MRAAKAGTALERARAGRAAIPGFNDPRVLRLTERVLELRRQSHRTLVTHAIETGEVLEEAKVLLRGTYTRWLREEVGIDPSTARNYLSLTALARDAPAIVATWHELGPTKLYRVARLTTEGRQEVLSEPTIADMTDGEFARLSAPWLARRREVTGNMRAHGLRQQVQAFSARLREVRINRIEDPTMRSGLRGDLAELARAARALGAQI